MPSRSSSLAFCLVRDAYDITFSPPTGLAGSPASQCTPTRPARGPSTVDLIVTVQRAGRAEPCVALAAGRAASAGARDGQTPGGASPEREPRARDVCPPHPPCAGDRRRVVLRRPGRLHVPRADIRIGVLRSGQNGHARRASARPATTARPGPHPARPANRPAPSALTAGERRRHLPDDEQPVRERRDLRRYRQPIARAGLLSVYGYISGVVPDGVASVTLRYPAMRGSAACTCCTADAAQTCSSRPQSRTHAPTCTRR